MAEPAESLPENPPVTGSEVGPGKPPEETRFEKGKSGNPGGRPKGLARKVREVLGDDDGEALSRFWAGVMSGYIVDAKPVLDADGKVVRHERVVVEISVSERIAVSKILGERGWGKPPQYAPIEEDDPLALSERASDDAAAEMDRRIDEVGERRKRREENLKKEDPGAET